jgi:hypothetical protein
VVIRLGRLTFSDSSRVLVARQVSSLAVVIEDREQFYGPLVRLDGVRGHRGELGRLPFVDQDCPLPKAQSNSSAEHREPFVSRVHLRLVYRTVGSDPHFGDRDAAAIALAREKPHGRTGACLGLGADDDVIVALWLNELVERRAKRLSDGHELIKSDTAMARLDATQRRRRQVAAAGERVEGPAPGDAKAPNPLADDLVNQFLRHTQ